ncbi:polysaccharide biosynthesis/export family protein [Glaciecola siphonariae]|uniref:Polysaccharide biosynthesis/export family protein n=1 Tax=Glaciecola siphonariae TaxID=521012 RepID=A0ABV9LWD1_9ALTE
MSKQPMSTKGFSITSYLFGLLMLALMGAQTANAQANKEYKLSTDDVISIAVFNEPDLDVKEAKISESGTISVPLLGQVVVKGKTVVEAQNLLTELFLADYLKQPRVTVSMVEFRPFYINGEVDKPGSYPYRTGMTVQMAITIAGGFTERASKSAIYLLPENSTTAPTRVDLNAEVQPGDVITIEESFF